MHVHGEIFAIRFYSRRRIIKNTCIVSKYYVILDHYFFPSSEFYLLTNSRMPLRAQDNNVWS